MAGKHGVVARSSCRTLEDVKLNAKPCDPSTSIGCYAKRDHSDCRCSCHERGEHPTDPIEAVIIDEPLVCRTKTSEEPMSIAIDFSDPDSAIALLEFIAKARLRKVITRVIIKVE